MMHNPSEDKDNINDFAQIITQLTETVDELNRLESVKAATASQGHHDRMDGLLKEEQACILKLRGLEQRRIRLQGGLGWGGLTFRQILVTAEKEQAGRLSPLFTGLEQGIKRLLDTRDTAQRAISARLREFASVLADMEGLSYDSSGEAEVEIPSHFHDRYV